MNNLLFSSWGDTIIDNRSRKLNTEDLNFKYNLPQTFRPDEKIKAIIGWNGFMIFADDVNVVELCRGYVKALNEQVCGKCIPCRTGTAFVNQTLDKICDGKGNENDIFLLKAVADTVVKSSKCGIGQTGLIPLLHALENFPDAFQEVVEQKTKPQQGKYYTKVTAPCIDACPMHIDIPKYVEYAKEGNFKDSLKTIYDKLPIPCIVGRVCVRPCEDSCRRTNLDESISIKYIKRFVGDQEANNIDFEDFRQENSRKKGKIAIIGAGPAGLTCAYHAILMGHQVTIYEKLNEPGGMSAIGIPDYRLPRPVLREEAEKIQALGVEIKYGVEIGKDITMSDLEKDNDAVFIGIGAQLSSAMRVEGEDAGYEGVIPGVQYLKDIADGVDPYPAGEKIVVIGGGNVAIDCVRSSFRVGKEDVNLLYRRTRNEMPADEVEIVDAEEEKVNFHFLIMPIKVVAKDNKVIGLECKRMELGEPDQSGRRRPVPIEGSDFVFECDTIVPAIGQKVDLSLIEGMELEITKWNTLIVNDYTKQTNRAKVFSAGDCETGPNALITASAGGRRAALSMDRMFNDEPLDEADDYFNSLFKILKPFDEDEKFGDFGKCDRKHLEMLPPADRKHSFDEVEKGYSTQEAIAEAERCWRCYRMITVAV